MFTLKSVIENIKALKELKKKLVSFFNELNIINMNTIIITMNNNFSSKSSLSFVFL